MRPRRPGRPGVEAAGPLTVEAFGVRIVLDIGGDRELEDAVRAVMPPGTRTVAPSHVGVDDTHPPAADAPVATFALHCSNAGVYVLRLDAATIAETPDLDVAVGTLDARMRMAIAMHTDVGVFVHAGVVAVGGRAVVMPGRSFAGKTTLVAALIAAGATYYSDEWAVLDDEGLVHPYAKSLSLRPRSAFEDRERSPATAVPPADLGAQIGDRGLPVGLVVVARYRPGATWAPVPRTRAQGLVALVANAPRASVAPARVLAVARRAVRDAAILEGERGEAAEAAEAVLGVLAAGYAKDDWPTDPDLSSAR